MITTTIIMTDYLPNHLDQWCIPTFEMAGSCYDLIVGFETSAGYYEVAMEGNYGNISSRQPGERRLETTVCLCCPNTLCSKLEI